MAITPHTPRRSKRFQPVAFSPTKRSRQSHATSSGASTSINWAGEPIETRGIDPVHDLTPEERDAWDAQDEQQRDGLKTRFYDAFEKCKSNQNAAQNRKKGKKRVDAAAAAAAEESREVYRVGDTILISTYSMLIGRRAPSAAVIVSMWETDFSPEDEEQIQLSQQDKMRIRIHWFLRPSELASIRAKREHLEDEIYYSVAGSEILTPESILSHCVVLAARPSQPKSSSKPGPAAARGYAYVPVPKPSSSDASSDDDDDDDDSDVEAHGQTAISLKGKQFHCFHAVDSRRGIFCSFDWEAHRRKALASGKSMDNRGGVWNVVIEDSRKKRPPKPEATNPRRKGSNREDSTDESEDSGEEYQKSSEEDGEEDDLPALDDSDSEDEAAPASSDEESTSPRKRKRSANTTSTPRKRVRTIAHPTPHSKKALARGKRGSRRKGDGTVSPSKSPRKRAFNIRAPQTFSASSQEAIKNLPKDPWLRAMHVLHVGSRPDAAGALKCRENEFGHILREVGELIEEGSGGCVYISGVPGTGKTATVHAVVRELKRMAESNEISPFTYVEINGLKIPEPSGAYTLLYEGLLGASNSKMSSKESLKALTRHFSGATKGPEGHACVVLMDELDQLFSTNKQDVVYNFFNWPTILNSKLVVIAVANTMDLPERVLEGRVRSRLGMTRINFAPYTTIQLADIVKTRLDSARIEDGNGNSQDVIAMDSIRLAAMKVANISGDARRVLDICRRAVEIASASKRTAKATDINEVMRIMQNSPTAAYLRDCSFHERVMLASLVKCIKRDGVEEVPWGEIQHQHLLYTPVLTTADTARRLTAYELKTVLESLVACRALLIEDGVVVARKPEDERKVVLNLDIGEVERVLAEVGGARWKNIL